MSVGFNFDRAEIDKIGKEPQGVVTLQTTDVFKKDKGAADVAMKGFHRAAVFEEAATGVLEESFTSTTSTATFRVCSPVPRMTPRIGLTSSYSRPYPTAIRRVFVRT